MEALYTAIAHATGNGRNGHVLSEDNRIDMDVRTPKEMGGSGEGTNPEQLFAAGYAACFLNAVLGVGRRLKIDTTDSAISASVSIGKISEYGFGLSGELVIYLPNVPAEQRQQVIDLADQACPYSNATRGNMDVTLTIVD
ncbi:MAG TPA: organic hydroperoxide resistance protein [Galbitalea sp.]|jgi:Ohr subfamily peroxiredoxin|nr:organic hydroperoxide resistance protein [Galbitalea sp.]